MLSSLNALFADFTQQFDFLGRAITCNNFEIGAIDLTEGAEANGVTSFNFNASIFLSCDVAAPNVFLRSDVALSLPLEAVGSLEDEVPLLRLSDSFDCSQDIGDLFGFSLCGVFELEGLLTEQINGLGFLYNNWLVRNSFLKH